MDDLGSCENEQQWPKSRKMYKEKLIGYYNHMIIKIEKGEVKDDSHLAASELLKNQKLILRGRSEDLT